MRNVRVVTAFVPLTVKHMTSNDYHALGQQMLNATDGRYHFFDGFPLFGCWPLADQSVLKLPPATETPADRYATPEDHVRSHIVQHCRTQWAIMASKLHPEVDTWIWLDLGILKQGIWNHKQVTAEHVAAFVDNVAKYTNDDIPFPGISGPGPVLPHGNNWRFCGSTHVWPKKYLMQIDRSYKANLINFIRTHQCMPLDLTIWPLVEQNSGLPFRWYQGEYDHTQLTNFPRQERAMRELTPLCQLAIKYETDKGGRHLRYGGGDSDTTHEYTPVYWDLLSATREQVKSVLEIGINSGASLRMWEEFFPNAQIVGFDCNPNTLINEGRIRSYLADQNDPHSLRNALQQAQRHPFDLIVDDGSHEPAHQIVSLQTLAPFLSPTGMYVIEDIHIDCHPEHIAQFTPEGFAWTAIKTEMGIGKAHCPCDECGGKGVEQLIVVRRKA